MYKYQPETLKKPNNKKTESVFFHFSSNHEQVNERVPESRIYFNVWLSVCKSNPNTSVDSSNNSIPTQYEL